MKQYLFIFLVVLFPQFAFAGSQTYSTVGSYSFTVPSYATLTVTVWAGGGGSSNYYATNYPGQAGGSSSFNGSVVAYGGATSDVCGFGAGAGGTATGGDSNYTGSAGGRGSGKSVGGVGGNGANGGGSGGAYDYSTGNGLAGSQPGGGGAGRAGCDGAGGGGASVKTYTSGQLTVGGTVSVVVGAGGVAGVAPIPYSAGAGAPGQVTITWTEPAVPTCTVTLTPSSVNQGSSSTLTYSSTDATTLYINNIGYVLTTGGSTTVSPSSTTNYSCTATGAGGTGTQAASLTVHPSCTLDGTTVTHGSSATAYLASTVPYGSTCSSQTRTCTDGTLSGSYAYTSCSVSPAASCTLDGETIAHGSSITAYSSQSASSGQLCSSISQSRTCSDGTLSGSSSYQYASCSCTPATVYSCSPQNVVRTVTSSSCTVTTTTPYATCTSPAFCSAGSAACLYPPIGFIASGDLSGHLVASPSLLPQGTPTTLYWNVDNVSSCTVTGNSQTFSGTSSDGQVTGNITQQTTFTLACTGLDGSTMSETITVNILPVFQEN